MVYQEGRHFVLHLLKFVFQINGKCLPTSMQILLDDFPIDEESRFTVNITKAVMVFVEEYLDFGSDNVVEISSPEFQTTLNSISLHEDFLEFLGYYTMKCLSETKDQPDCPAIFLAAVTNYLEKVKNLEDVCMLDYWDELDQAAARIVVRDREIYEGRCQSLKDPYFEIDITSERAFIIDVMNCIFDIFEMPQAIKLQHEDGRPARVLSSYIQRALVITVNHHRQRYNLLRDYELMNNHFHNICTTGYNDEDFLQYCVCCTRQAIFEYNNDQNFNAPKLTCDHLVKVLQTAKEDGKFTSLEKMRDAAVKLIKINKERIAHMQNRYNIKRKSDCIGNPSDSSKKSSKETH